MLNRITAVETIVPPAVIAYFVPALASFLASPQQDLALC